MQFFRSRTHMQKHMSPNESTSHSHAYHCERKAERTILPWWNNMNTYVLFCILYTVLNTSQLKSKQKWFVLIYINFFLLFFRLQITLLINNAGVVSGRALLDTPDHLIERSFNVNVLAHFWVRNMSILNDDRSQNTTAHCFFLILWNYFEQNDLAAFFQWMKRRQNIGRTHIYVSLPINYYSLKIRIIMQAKLNCATKSKERMNSFFLDWWHITARSDQIHFVRRTNIIAYAMHEQYNRIKKQFNRN